MSTPTPWTEPAAIDDPFLKVGLAAVQAAEQSILEYFNHQPTIEFKADHSPVTIADRTAEQIIKQVIHNTFPDHSFLGEEEGQSHGDSEYTWIIDPIDGTKQFVRGMSEFGTLLALHYKNEFMVGISYMPALQSLVYAVKGQGAYHNHRPIQMSSVDTLDQAYISIASMKYFIKNNVEVGSLKLSEVVRHFRAFNEIQAWHYLFQGKIDAQIEAYGKPWDFAAHALITQEAGGQVTDLQGKPFTLQSTSILASNGLLHQQLLRFFRL